MLRPNREKYRYEIKGEINKNHVYNKTFFYNFSKTSSFCKVLFVPLK